jgi:tetratricopeptide (TPR) repeat protein
MTWRLFSTNPKTQSPKVALSQVDYYLNDASKALNENYYTVAFEYCNSGLVKLKEAEKGYIKMKTPDEEMNREIALAYFKHGKLLKDMGHHDKAKKSFGKAKKWGYDEVI